MALIDEEPNGCWFAIDFFLSICVMIWVAYRMDYPPETHSILGDLMSLVGVWLIGLCGFVVGHAFTRLGFLFAAVATWFVLVLF